MKAVYDEIDAVIREVGADDPYILGELMQAWGRNPLVMKHIRHQLGLPQGDTVDDRRTAIGRARDIFADYIDMGKGYEPSPGDAKVLLDAFEAAEAQLERVREALTYVDQGQTLVVRSRILRALNGEEA
jgi:hypothetical protein